MDSQLILLILATLAIGLLASMLLLWRRRTPSIHSPPAPSATVVGGQHKEGVNKVAAAPRTKPRMITPAGALVIMLPLLILGTVGWFFYNQITTNAADRFVVLVAYFDDGGDGATGRNVAEALARQITQQVQRQITVNVIAEHPTDTQAALKLANAQQSDVLIWGSVEPGAMLDSQSLSPNLIYTPNGAYAPNGWDGYLGRFALPHSYTLASEPINGQVVLPYLVEVLFDYGQGQSDRAATTLNRLLADYPALNGPLPQVIYGNVLWARSSYSEAATIYRQALATPSDEQALLANNLGAILLDAGDPAVLSAFSETVRLLNGKDLGELRYNLGLLALANQNPTEAISNLEAARNLLKPSTPLLLSLTEAYRESGRLSSAANTLETAAQQVTIDQRQVAAVYQTMFSQRLDGTIREQRGMLGLARNLNAQGPLVWEVEIATPIPENTISALCDQLRAAVDASQQASAHWHQRSASDSATDAGAGQAATGQADRAESAARRQRYELAILDIELTRSRSGSRTTAISFLSALFGGTTPMNESLSLINDLEQLNPDSPTILLAKARALRINNQLNEADRAYDQVVQVAAQRPEGYFGKGMIARDRGDHTTAAQLLRMAIERNDAFFPARYELAQIAQEQGNQDEAITQLRFINQQRPGPAAAIALAHTLRVSGAAGFIEAEQVLMPLSATNADAAIELGRLYNDAGHTDTAIQAYRNALTIDPRNTTASFELGERLAAIGDLQGAEKALRDALSFNSKNTAARLALARLYEGPLAKPDLADKEYGVALRQGVNDINALLAIGDTALQNNNPNQAISAYTKALQIQPQNPLPQYKIAQAYLLTNRLQSAADAAQQVLNLTANSSDQALQELRAQALVVLGDVARHKGTMSEATTHYTQAQQIDPQMIGAQLGMGQVAVGQGQWGVALGYFETATSLPGGNDNADAQFWLAESLLRNGNLDLAVVAYNRAIQIRPIFPEALLGIAQVQYTQSNLTAALETVERSLAQRNDYAEALLFKGKLLQAQGQTNEAMNAYNAAIHASDKIAEAYYRRGMLQISNEQYDNAVNDMRRAILLQPNFPEANYWLGRAYYAQSHLQSARDAFKHAVDLNTNYTEALYYLGLVAEDLGRRDEAINAYQTVIIADSNGEWGTRARDQLNRMQQ